jgi:hypothetical protein
LNPAAACRVFGFCLFAMAFFLPACGSHGSSFRGYFCAAFTLTSPYSDFSANGSSLSDWLRASLLAVSGWVNPLVLLYLLALARRKIERFRRPLAMAILACLATAWIAVLGSGRIFASFAQVRPLIGQYLWTAGILLILTAEALPLSWLSAQIRRPQAAMVCRIVGGLLFITAFFVPAVTDMPGYECAWYTLTNGVLGLLDGPFALLLLLPGLTNVFVIGYLVAIARKRERLGARFAVATLVGLGIAVVLVLSFTFERSDVGPHIHALVGHYLWIAGILLVLAPDWNRRREKSTPQCA